jgi:hypothetical protein
MISGSRLAGLLMPCCQTSPSGNKSLVNYRKTCGAVHFEKSIELTIAAETGTVREISATRDLIPKKILDSSSRNATKPGRKPEENDNCEVGQGNIGFNMTSIVVPQWVEYAEANRSHFEADVDFVRSTWCPSISTVVMLH